MTASGHWQRNMELGMHFCNEIRKGRSVKRTLPGDFSRYKIPPFTNNSSTGKNESKMEEIPYESDRNCQKD